MEQKEPLDSRRPGILRKVHRAVIKLGSSVLVEKNGILSTQVMRGIADGIHKMHGQGLQAVLVTSGAIACGFKALGFEKKPVKMTELQACAAVGQSLLMQHYQKAFGPKRAIAQVLLTRNDLEDRTRFLNAKHTLTELLNRQVLPIINENDTVVVDEIRFGDNDTLAALVTNVADADLLILLTDQDGFFTADPRHDPAAQRIPLIENLDPTHFARASDKGTDLSVGGMKTKLEAARKAAEFGVPTIIASGHDPLVLQKILEGGDIGTLILPRLDSLTARKHWIAHTLKAGGTVTVDDGASQALREGKKSLLPSGIRGVRGHFAQGEAVEILTTQEKPIGRGLAAYNSSEIEKIMGKRSSEIEKILGYKGPDEVIHRDDLVLL
jgi:glutamate 5-kinase